MSDNSLQTLQTAVQDVIAPDVRELKVKVAALQEQSRVQYEALRQQIAVFPKSRMPSTNSSRIK